MATLADLFNPVLNVPSEQTSEETASFEIPEPEAAEYKQSVFPVTFFERVSALKSVTKEPVVDTEFSNSASQNTMYFTSYTPITDNKILQEKGFVPANIEKLFKEEGIDVKITSGIRAAGAAGKAGSRSHHITGNAVDIVPIDGDFTKLKNQILNNPKIIEFFELNNLGIIDETDPKMMARTGATGKHFHIGKDKLAQKTLSDWLNKTVKYTSNVANLGNNTEQSMKDWTIKMFTAYRKALKDKFKSEYSDEHYDKIARYMTYQSALESGYGKSGRKNNNYGGHMYKGEVLSYGSLDEFVRKHMKILDKWKNYITAGSLEDYVRSMYQGAYRYNAHDPESKYYSAIASTSRRVDSYLATINKN